MDRTEVLTAAGLGAVAGMRSLSAPAFLAHRLSGEHAEAHGEGPLAEMMSSKASAWTLGLLAVGELVADKLPGIPARISPPALIIRLASGAFVGAGVARRAKRPVIGLAVVGAVAALASSFVLYEVRRFATEKLRVPNFVAGLLEDVLVAKAGARLTEAIG